jgi:Derlin-2/3
MMIVYLWSRRNEHARLNLLAMFTFTAPYLYVRNDFFICLLKYLFLFLRPWVFLLLSLVFGGGTMQNIIGIAVGHLYFFLDTVYPRIAAIRGWSVQKIIVTPKWVTAICASVGLPVQSE